MKIFLSFIILSTLINAQTNPCEDERYLLIKEKSLDDMSDREYNYFLSAEKKCEKFSESSSANNSETIKDKELIIKKSSDNLKKTNPSNPNQDKKSVMVPINKEPYSGEIKSSGYNTQNIYFFLSYDFNGDFSQDIDNGVGESSEEMSNQFSIGGEFLFNRTNLFKLGAGGEFQLFRKYKDPDLSEVGNLSFISIYGTAHFYLEPEKLYAIGRLGLSYQNFDNDFKGDWEFEPGAYFAVGSGLKLGKNLSVENLYSLNGGFAEIELSNVKFKNTLFYSKIGIALKLDLSPQTKKVGKSGLIPNSIY